MDDLYYTIASDGEGVYKEKMSKFLAFAKKARNADEAKAIIKTIQNEYHDARHVCWAYMIGPARNEWQLNDNGEPSGTAGRPILGQINSFGVTDVVVAVVRYFGGIKLGTPGLIAAYKEAARLALEDAGKKEMYKLQTISINFPYQSSNEVMKIAKGEDIEVKERSFDNTCSMIIEVKESEVPRIRGKLGNIDGVTFFD